MHQSGLLLLVLILNMNRNQLIATVPHALALGFFTNFRGLTAKNTTKLEIFALTLGFFFFSRLARYNIDNLVYVSWSNFDCRGKLCSTK